MSNQEYICFKCFTVHLGKICPKCNPPQPKKTQPKKTKSYELVLSCRDEHGEADDLYHFRINGKALEDIKYAKEIWVDCECNSIDVNEFNAWELVDQYDWKEAPKYIQKIAKKIMS